MKIILKKGKYNYIKYRGRCEYCGEVIETDRRIKQYIKHCNTPCGEVIATENIIPRKTCTECLEDIILYPPEKWKEHNLLDEDLNMTIFDKIRIILNKVI